MQHAQHAADLELVSELSSEDLQTAILVMSPDADLAGDLESSKSTSGLRLHPVSITRFSVKIFSPGSGLLRNPFFNR